jgi:TonB family protein
LWGDVGASELLIQILLDWSPYALQTDLTDWSSNIGRSPGMRLIGLFLAVVTFGALVSAQEVFTPGDGVSRPTLVTMVKPVYTEAAKEARIQGEVQLEAVVLADGSVGDVIVTKSLDTDNGLDQQAIGALRQWVFKPGTKDDLPVAVRVDVQMTFALE